MNKLYFFLFFLLSILSGFAQEIDIYCIGDSTMADKENPMENPEHGWAQVLGDFFDHRVEIVNRAANGRSSKSFINEGKWDSVLKTLTKGDFVFIQFGHNDQKIKDPTRYTNPHTTYRRNLIRFVDQTREKLATPVIFTSIVRRNFNEYGSLIDTHGAYPLEARLVAQELKVPLIDLQYLTEKMETSQGVERSKTLHLHFAPGEHSYYPEGIVDDTHLSRKGALLIAREVISEIKRQGLGLDRYIKQ